MFRRSGGGIELGYVLRKMWVLTGGVIWLIKFNLRCPCIIAPAVQWVAFLCTMLFVGSIE